VPPGYPAANLHQGSDAVVVLGINVANGIMNGIRSPRLDARRIKS
jgi:hypothetical protein